VEVQKSGKKGRNRKPRKKTREKKEQQRGGGEKRRTNFVMAARSWEARLKKKNLKRDKPGSKSGKGKPNGRWDRSYLKKKGHVKSFARRGGRWRWRKKKKMGGWWLQNRNPLFTTGGSQSRRPKDGGVEVKKPKYRRANSERRVLRCKGGKKG